MSESVDHPAHYGQETGHEAIDVIQAHGLGFCSGNAVKYILRAGKKPGSDMATDLRKAIWYLQRAVETLEAEERQMP